MTSLSSRAHHKPLDFGAHGVKGSVDQDGKLIALNFHQTRHGYVTLTTVSPCIMRLKQTAHCLKPTSLKPGLLSLDTGLPARMLSSREYHSKPFTHEYTF